MAVQDPERKKVKTRKGLKSKITEMYKLQKWYIAGHIKPQSLKNVTFFYSQTTSTDLLLKLKLGPRSFLRGGDPSRTLCHRSSSVFNWFARWEEDVEEDVGEGEGVEMEELGLGEQQQGDGGTMIGSWLCGTLTLRSESWVIGSFGSFKQIPAATLDILIVDRKEVSFHFNNS